MFLLQDAIARREAAMRMIGVFICQVFYCQGFDSKLPVAPDKKKFGRLKGP
jgi:hypothetical protein